MSQIRGRAINQTSHIDSGPGKFALVVVVQHSVPKSISFPVCLSRRSKRCTGHGISAFIFQRVYGTACRALARSALLTNPSIGYCCCNTLDCLTVGKNGRRRGRTAFCEQDDSCHIYSHGGFNPEQKSHANRQHHYFWSLSACLNCPAACECPPLPDLITPLIDHCCLLVPLTFIRFGLTLTAL